MAEKKKHKIIYEKVKDTIKKINSLFEDSTTIDYKYLSLVKANMIATESIVERWIVEATEDKNAAGVLKRYYQKKKKMLPNSIRKKRKLII